MRLVALRTNEQQRLEAARQLANAHKLHGTDIKQLAVAFQPDGRDDDAAKLSMPVIVGRAAKARETPVFIGEMRYIEFSPYWNVPPAIQRSETVPRLARDPGYSERENLEAVPPSRRSTRRRCKASRPARCACASARAETTRWVG